jgi:hypothetical protein
MAPNSFSGFLEKNVSKIDPCFFDVFSMFFLDVFFDVFSNVLNMPNVKFATICVLEILLNLGQCSYLSLFLAILPTICEKISLLKIL